MNIARRMFCLLVAAICLLAGAMAQVQTSELHVLVKDAKGAVVSGATVTAAEPRKGISRTATTNAEGLAIPVIAPSRSVFGDRRSSRLRQDGQPIGASHHRSGRRVGGAVVGSRGN